MEALQGKPAQETLRLVTVPAPKVAEQPLPVPAEIINAKPDEIGFAGQTPSGETIVAAVVEKRRPGRPRKVTE